MKLSISNIGWEPGQDSAVYQIMHRYGFSGLEIAPTRILSENPYDRTEEAKQWQEELYLSHGFAIPSMQSIWYGRTENIFRSAEERASALAYTKKAILFAEAVKCGNLVFGCPRNRVLVPGADLEVAVPFFRELGNYAAAHGTVLSMEANPPIYHTNYINRTEQAVELIRQVGSAGFRLNLDVGTMIENSENLDVIKQDAALIHHVHISEPGLKEIKERPLHRELAQLLRDNGYSGFISIEMGKQQDLHIIDRVCGYVKGIFE